MKKKSVDKSQRATSYNIVNKKASTKRPSAPKVTCDSDHNSNSQEKVKVTSTLCGDKR